MHIGLRIIDPKMTLFLPRVLIWPLFLCAQKLHALTTSYALYQHATFIQLLAHYIVHHHYAIYSRIYCILNKYCDSSILQM